MIEKKVKYTDLNGNEQEDTLYFHLNKPELMEMNLSPEGGLANYVKKIQAENDLKKIFELFKELLLKSYGVKSEDGKEFIKDPELTRKFSQSEAYSELFMDVASDSNKAIAFIKGLLPANMQKEINEEDIKKQMENVK